MSFKMINTAHLYNNKSETIDDILIRDEHMYLNPSKLINYNNKYIYIPSFNIDTDLDNTTIKHADYLSRSRNNNLKQKITSKNPFYQKEELLFDETQQQWTLSKK
ncbi:MAG: hypothetical protein ACW98X_21315 [Promethearchaeota archaeon]|jgi:hypothetical protein